MRVVLDTNVLLQIISSKSEHYWIWEALRTQQFTLCITSDILLEYEEILLNKRNPELTQLVLEVILLMPNLARVETYFHFGLPSKDPDDQKFVDCAIACGADYLITEDKHFEEVKHTPFPSINIMGPHQFRLVWESYLKSRKP